MVTQQRIYHWKHGWIPLDRYAALEKDSGRDSATKLQPQPTAAVRSMDELSPALQGKIGAKLESLTGMPEPQLAAKVQANLARFYAEGNKADLNWYPDRGAEIAARADATGTTVEKMTGMVAVTSAHKRWQENLDVAQAIAARLHEDKPFEVDQGMIDSYNLWASSRKGSLKPHPELKPGTYKPSDLPSDFAAARTPRMPRLINADYNLSAVKIYRGESEVGQQVNGPKQRSFVNNLLVPDDPRSVTSDTWHYRAAMHGIPLTRTIGPKGAQKTYSYTLEQWADRELARTDGRSDMFGYDPALAPSSAHNVKAIMKATPAPQEFFQSGPAAKAEGYDGSYGTYPWFTKQTQAAATREGVSPSAVQAVIWTSVGGGL